MVLPALFVMLPAFCSSYGAQLFLAWDPPTLNADGTPLTDLAGFRLHYGAESGSYTEVIDVGFSTSIGVTNLHPHTRYFFAVTAIDRQGRESEPSEELIWAYDSDADEMADTWEGAYFGPSNLAETEPDGDEDSDGASNLAEFVAGTDPLDPSSLAVIEIEGSRRNKTILVSFLALATAGVEYSGLTRHYALEECDNLVSGEWRAVESLSDVAGTNQYVEHLTEIPDGSRYYRTRIWLE